MSNNIMRFCDDYTIIDIETTGLSRYYDEIIELSALKVKDNKVVGKFNSLVKPEYEIPEFITELTGISNEMVKDAPNIHHVLPEYIEFIADDIIVGHNVHFDIGFINQITAFSKDYIDTMSVSRVILPELAHHRLSDLSNFFGIDYSNAHRANEDCIITFKCYEGLRQKATESGIDITQHRKKLRSKDIIAKSSSFNETALLYNKVCVFTGELSIERKELMQMVADVGGKNADTVTKKTDYLIVGDYSANVNVKGGKTGKLKKAEDYILKGVDISIISEKDFFDLLNGVVADESDDI